MCRRHYTRRILKRSKIVKREYAYVWLDMFICFLRTVHVYIYFIVFCLDIGYPYTNNNPIGPVVFMGPTNKLTNTHTYRLNVYILVLVLCCWDLVYFGLFWSFFKNCSTFVQTILIKWNIKNECFKEYKYTSLY